MKITLPWLTLHSIPSEGRDLAVRRLRTTIRKLEAADIFETYQDVTQKWLKEGII